MKDTWNRLLAALLACMLLCGVALAEADVEALEIEAPVEEVVVSLAGEDEDAALSEVEAAAEVVDEAAVGAAEDSELAEAEYATNPFFENNYNIGVGQTIVLTIPSGGTAFMCSDPKKLDMELLGNELALTGLKVGAVRITAKVPEYGVVTFPVTVRKAPEMVSFAKTELNLKKGKTAVLKVKLYPSIAATALYFESSDPSVAKVDQKGKVTAKGVGTAMIYAVSHNGRIAYCPVHVSSVAKTLELDCKKITMSVRDVYPLTAAITPSHTNETVTFKSSNTSVATVDDEGMIVARRNGTAVITASIPGTSLTAKCTVTVLAAKTLKLDSSKTMRVGQSLTLTPKVTPAKVDAKLTFTSSNEDVAFVDDDGEVYAVAPGRAVITVKTANGLIAKCTVRVYRVSLSAKRSTVKVGKKLSLYAVVEPVVKNLSLKWESSDTTVATVSNGVVKGVKPGEATIRVKISGRLMATYDVKVEK